MNLARLECIENLLNESIINREIAGANVSIIHKGKEVYYAQAGFADIAANKKIERDTIFRLYSMSKPVTAAAVMMLVERGTIELLDPVSKYIDTFKNPIVGLEDGEVAAYREITIKDCMDMTSGLPYGFEPNKSSQDICKVFDELDQRLCTDNSMTTMEFARKIGKCRLAFQPGDQWRYGVSADILGAVIESVTGMQFGEFLKKELFEPLGMKDTGFGVAKENLGRLAVAYETTPTDIIPYTGNHLGIVNAMDRKITFESGGAGLVSTIEDYKHFTQMLMNKGTYEGRQYLGSKTVEYLTGTTLLPNQARTYGWDSLQGFSYGNLMRIMTDVSHSTYMTSEGEYGWDGWLGPYFSNMPKDETTFLMMVQKKDAGTFALTRKLRNVVASAM